MTPTDTTVGLELARGNFLRPNGHGGYIIRQSDLSSWSRCQLQKYYEDRGRANPDAPQGEALSATTYGSVMHYALQILEGAIQEGREDALDVAQRTFEYYWHPENLHELGLRVTQWLPRQTYGGLRDRGRIALRDYYELLSKEDSHLIALEYQFAVPMPIDGRLHTLTGTADRLSIRKHATKPYLSVDDFKTGKQPTYLRFNPQGSAYAWASTQPEFWAGWAESNFEDLEHFDDETIARLERMFFSWGYRLHGGSPAHGEQELPLASRRFRWINIQEIKFVDAGWRNERDYARLQLAIDAYIRSCEAEAYSVTTTGEICKYCAYKGICGGVGLPHENAGAP